jgi:hypothetical protein
MYIAALISLLSGIFFSGVFLNGFELILSNVLVPIINYIKSNNNNPYKIKIVHYIENEEEKIETAPEVKETNDLDNDIDKLLNKINLANTKPDAVYIDEKLD